MAGPDVIDNPLFEKETNPLESVKFKSADDHRLIDPVMNPVKNFAQEFAKDGPFFQLKFANWILILLLAIAETIGLDYNLQLEHWSEWRSTVNIPYFDYPYYYYGLNYMTALTWLWLFAITFSLVMHYLMRKNVENYKNFLSCLSLMDVCFWAVFFLNFPMIFLCYAIRTINEYLWFFPRLINGTPLKHLTKYTSYGSSENWSEYAINIMEIRRNAITTLLFLDPIVTILALLIIVLSIAYVWRIRSAIKRTDMWESDYKKIHPQCSKLDAGYAKLWPIEILKVIHWIVPAYLCLGPFGRFLGSQTIVYKLSTACCFGFFLYRWISFVKTVRFRNQNLNDAPKEGLGSDIKLDSFICLLGIIFYLIIFLLIHGIDKDDTQIVSLIGVFFFICSLLANVSLMYKHNGFRFKTLQISFNVTIKVNKENTEEDKIKEEKKFCAYI